LAASPAVGLFAGAGVVHAYGYKGAILCLLGLSLALLCWSATRLPETRPADRSSPPLREVSMAMLRDAAIWRSAVLVAAFNIALYSYYTLGPFIFERLRLSAELYGYTGVILAMGSSGGAWLNKRLLARGWQGEHLTGSAAVLLLGAGITIQTTSDTTWFLLPMLLAVVAFGIAIPNVLGDALVAYHDRLGTAGAFFGLMYYLMIGAGILLVGYTQALGGTVIVCGGFALMAYIARAHRYRRGAAPASADTP
jgi:predicted MFS family arabinose efflux permease